MSDIKIIPSDLQFQSAPSVDQKITVTLNESPKTLVEYDRTSNVSLAQVFEDERNDSAIFRPTFKFSSLYENIIKHRDRSNSIEVKNLSWKFSFCVASVK